MIKPFDYMGLDETIRDLHNRQITWGINAKPESIAFRQFYLDKLDNVVSMINGTSPVEPKIVRVFKDDDGSYEVDFDLYVDGTLMFDRWNVQTDSEFNYKDVATFFGSEERKTAAKMLEIHLASIVKLNRLKILTGVIEVDE